MFRFEDQMTFLRIFPITGISEEEFYRLIYVFLCSDVVTIEEMQAETVLQRRVMLENNHHHTDSNA